MSDHEYASNVNGLKAIHPLITPVILHVKI